MSVHEYYEYPDSVYSEYEISEFLYKYYWCEKVGGKIYHYGVCSELEHNIKKHKSLSKKKRRNKRERDLKHKEYLKRLEKISRGYPWKLFMTLWNTLNLCRQLR